MYFTLSQHQYLVLALLGGLLMLVVLIVGYFSVQLTTGRRERDEEREGHEFPDGLVEGNRPIPLFIIVLGGTILLWAIFYAIAVATGVIHVQ